MCVVDVLQVCCKCGAPFLWEEPIILDYTRGAGGPKGLVSNHLKSAWIGGNEEDGGKLKRMDDARFSLFDTDYEIKPSEVVIFC